MSRPWRSLLLGTMGLAVLLAGACGAPFAIDEAQFWGGWMNVDPATRGITQVEIQPGRVHMWGSCSPTDCDWGWSDYSVRGDQLTTTWDQGFAIRIQILSIGGDGTLAVRTTSRFTDGTDRDYVMTDYFRRVS